MIDASLAAPGALPPGVSALDAHARLFEVERLIHNVAHLAEVTLIAGDLPGSAIVSAQAAAAVEGRGALLRRLRLDPPAQIAIRVAVAVAVASALGSAVSERRFYWAVLAVFVTFVGTNTSGEQVIKAIHRVVGTIAGVLIGSLLANAIGHSTWSLAVIIGALGLGIYFFKLSFAAFVTALTIALAQLYSQLGEYSNHLLAVRLEETAIGGAVAIAAAVWIFPDATRRAARLAERAYLGSLADLLGRVTDHLREQPDAQLSSSSRALDHAHQQLLTTARPLARNPWRRDRIQRNRSLYNQTALARGLEPGRSSIDARPLDDALLAAIDEQLGDRGEPPNRQQRRLVRHLDRLDETIAELGTNLSREPTTTTRPMSRSTTTLK